jgi:hypothetical protein
MVFGGMSIVDGESDEVVSVGRIRFETLGARQRRLVEFSPKVSISTGLTGMLRIGSQISCCGANRYALLTMTRPPQPFGCWCIDAAIKRNRNTTLLPLSMAACVLDALPL